MRALKVEVFFPSGIIYLSGNRWMLSSVEKNVFSVVHNHKFLNIWSHDEIANMTETVQEHVFFQIPLTPPPLIKVI